jgi:peptidylprolyl isomerase
MMRTVRAGLPLTGLMLLSTLLTGLDALAQTAPQSAAPAPAASGGAVTNADVVAQRGDVKITASELGNLLANADPAVRERLEGNQTALADFVKERLISETLLAQARAKGWDQRPDIRQRANEARDQAILQSYVMSLIPPDPAFPSSAQIATAYEANKSRMIVPKQYHIAQIVILVPPNSPPEADAAAKRKAQDLRALAVKPKADFADLAKKNSQEGVSAPKGGDVGWLREDQLLPVIREVVSKIPDNGISEPVRAPDGWHVLRVIETRPTGPMSLADATPQIIPALRQARLQQAVRAYVANMLQSEPIELNDAALSKELAPK